MQRNIGPLAAVLIPLIPWAVGTAATVGGSYWGYRWLEEYRESSTQELEQQRQAALSAQQESAARTRQTLTQLNPFFIAGTIAMTGLGAFIMVRGMKRERSRRQRELMEAYRGL